MTEERASGLILRVRALTDTSLIVHWLTAEQGRIATVAKGARRPKSAFRGKLDLFFAADFLFRRSRRSELHLLCEVSIRETHAHLRQDFPALQAAAYAATLMELATETDTPVPEMHALLSDWLRQQISPATRPQTVLGLEARVLALSGHAPDRVPARLTPGSRALLEHLLTLPWEDLPRLRLAPAQLAELSRHLGACLESNWSRLPRGRDAALAS